MSRAGPVRLLCFLVVTWWVTGATLAYAQSTVFTADGKRYTGQLTVRDGRVLVDATAILPPGLEPNDPEAASFSAVLELRDVERVVLVTKAHEPIVPETKLGRALRGFLRDAGARARSARANAKELSRVAEAWEVELVTDDLLPVSHVTVNDDAAQLELESVEIAVPRGAMKAVWAKGDLGVAARALEVDARDTDVAFIQKDGAVRAVNGRVVALDGTGLRFEFEGEERSVGWERLAGLLFATASQRPPVSGLRVRAHATDGWSLTVADLSHDARGNSVLFPWWGGDRIELPADTLESFEVHGGRLQWLTDLEPSRVEYTPFFDTVPPYRRDVSLDGAPLRLRSGRVDRGISVHARTVLRYDLRSVGVERFLASVGFQIPDGRFGCADIRVLEGDGTTLFEWIGARGSDEPRPVDLDVRGVATLVLEVDFGAEQDVGDRVVWARARLLRR